MTKKPFIAHSELTNEIYIVIGKEKYCVTEQAIKAVVAIKALEQEPKIGHKVSGDFLGGLYCSECMTYVNEYFNYCPHCGAKMESED